MSLTHSLFGQISVSGEFHGQRSLAGYYTQGCKESNTIQRLTTLANITYGIANSTVNIGIGTTREPAPYHRDCRLQGWVTSGQTIGAGHSHFQQQKIRMKITEYSPAHQSKTQFSPQPIPAIRKLAQASYSYPSEGRQNENHSHRKLTKMITRNSALYNSMNISLCNYANENVHCLMYTVQCTVPYVTM